MTSNTSTDGGEHIGALRWNLKKIIEDNQGHGNMQMGRDPATIDRAKECLSAIDELQQYLDPDTSESEDGARLSATITVHGWECDICNDEQDGDMQSLREHLIKEHPQEMTLGTQRDDTEQLDCLNKDEELVETPLDTNKLSLNPGYEQAPRNPLCPVCEQEIQPISNHAERRFVCGCEQVWQFTFDRLKDTETEYNDR